MISPDFEGYERKRLESTKPLEDGRLEKGCHFGRHAYGLPDDVVGDLGGGGGGRGGVHVLMEKNTSQLLRCSLMSGRGRSMWVIPLLLA
jgi:hypothetical protein